MFSEDKAGRLDALARDERGEGSVRWLTRQAREVVTIGDRLNVWTICPNDG